MYDCLNFEIKPKQKGIFIHIPRTGGIMISRHVYPWASRMFLAHATATFVRDNVSTLLWDKMFTFAFVRNPWARIVSYYLMYKRYTQYSRKRPIDFDSFLMYDTMIMGSFAFNGWMINSEALWSQKIFLCDGDEVIMDFIGRSEQLDEDLGFVCDKLEIKKDWRKKNNNPPYDYHDFYTTETKKLIAKRCNWEINRFNYSF